MCSPATGKSYEPPTPKHFSFNAPAGACPVCHGLGQKMVFDEGLVVPDPEKSLESAVQPWRRAGKRMIIYYKAMLRVGRGAFQREPGNAVERSAGRFQEGAAARFGRRRSGVPFLARGQACSTISRPFEGVLPNLERLFTESESEFIRNRLKALHEPAVLRRVQGQAAQAGNPGGDAGRSESPESGLHEWRRGKLRNSELRNSKFENSRPVHHGRLRAVGGKGG